MADLFTSGRIADLLLILLALETAALLRWVRGVPPAEVLTFAGAGACLILAVRLALTNAPWPWIALGLATAGILQAAQLWLRHRAGTS